MLVEQVALVQVHSLQIMVFKGQIPFLVRLLLLVVGMVVGQLERQAETVLVEREALVAEVVEATLIQQRVAQEILLQ